MTQGDFGDILAVSMDKIKEFADAETVIGEPIYAPGGLTVIPVSRVSMGIATGGLDLKNKKEAIAHSPRFGAGGGTGMNITPIAFLMISEQGVYDLVPIGNPDEKDAVTRIADLIEKSPAIAKKLKNVFVRQSEKKAKKDENTFS